MTLVGKWHSNAVVTRKTFIFPGRLYNHEFGWKNQFVKLPFFHFAPEMKTLTLAKKQPCCILLKGKGELESVTS